MAGTITIPVSTDCGCCGCGVCPDGAAGTPSYVTVTFSGIPAVNIGCSGENCDWTFLEGVTLELPNNAGTCPGYGGVLPGCCFQAFAGDLICTDGETWPLYITVILTILSGVVCATLYAGNLPPAYNNRAEVPRISSASDLCIGNSWSGNLLCASNSSIVIANVVITAFA